ncbi:hypothetical protein B0J11DRAFT_41996 [Dendryphion nanum]|uniref:DUF1765-domain-containing protein n=1 Tax=Dendryphion nanum TaxID=256645 RepID=A0A9P9EKL0_9PLEO|nr:hypothetical protein B0J11DRAFT_41996 [Dendryphion nanum]
MQVAPALTGHDLLANSIRGRTRSSSDAYPPAAPREHEPAQLPKAASYTYFPRVKDLDDTTLLELKGTISEDDLKSGAASGDVSGSSSGDSSPTSENGPKEQMPELRSSSQRLTSRFLPFSSKSRDPSEEPKPGRSRRQEATKKTDASPSISPARSLSRLRRKSWISPPSPSNSPTKEKNKDKQSAVEVDEPGKGSLNGETSKRFTQTGTSSIPEDGPAKDFSVQDTTEPRSRVLTKKSKRPLSSLFTSTNAQQSPPPASHAPSKLLVPKSFSTDKFPLYTSPTTPTHIPPIPRNLSHDKLKGAKTEPRKKDELWSVFRTLEADLRKFQSKSSSLKANVVRTNLLPFLRTYAAHPSNHRLRPEDLDRRANILSGWWTGLLELLSGRNNQSLSGTDRPAILEGIAGVMERPEWRMAPSPFSALAERSETSSTTTMNSAGSNSSGSSDFLAESVYHNVRNIFTTNLLSQMAFVVDKMSLRNAAASLVTFCGKTCAYAFCFCPGVADILVRLWNPSLDLMKRVLDESGISRQDRLDLVSDRIVPTFPPTLHTLKFTSLATTTRLLRRPASLPFGTGNLDWYGSWVKRWSGAESDLFYVFVKHYHILIADFLPVEPSIQERMCVPGIVMVHAQVLANLDATINRHTNPQQAEDTTAGATAVTFDDVLGDPDASASTLPIPPANATRQMAENRGIMLIRDFLSERNSHLHVARRIFADGFSRLLKAAARSVSVYDNNACYTLCDFLEEAFIILVRYEQLDLQRHSVLDWPFWLTVCKQMTTSHNTATEIKLFAFLYSIWPTLAVNEKRRTSLCLEFLLVPEFFESRFNHWCPMVRSYYMRLLCWRVARFDGQDTPAELEIMKTLSERLRSVWSHYLWLREEADIKQALPHSTTACNPAPGRRFLIIRNDNPVVNNAGPFISFDGVIQSPNRRLSGGSSATDSDARPQSAKSTDSDFGEEEAGKGRWNMLRNLIGAKPTLKTKNSSSAKKENTKPASNAASKTPETSPSKGKSTPESSPPPSTHRSYSFRFSLEWVDKRFGVYQNMRLNPPRLPLPASNLLQSKQIHMDPVGICKPTGPAAASSRYAGRALAEWTFISHECQNFFDRRKNEGVPSNKQVETPTLAVEAFRRPG